MSTNVLECLKVSGFNEEQRIESDELNSAEWYFYILVKVDVLNPKTDANNT